MKKHKKKSTIIPILVSHIRNNARDYFILLLLFLTGIIIGTVFINNTSEQQKNEISTYIYSFMDSIKENKTVNYTELIKETLMQNGILVIILWFCGTAIMLLPIIYGMVIFRGFSLGYTISAIVATIGSGKGTVFVLLSLLLHNIFFIPSILAIAGSGIRLYRAIVKDKNTNNIKKEIYKHTAFCLIISVLLVISSFVEVFISSNLLVNYIRMI